MARHDLASFRNALTVPLKDLQFCVANSISTAEQAERRHASAQSLGAQNMFNALYPHEYDDGEVAVLEL